jgi:hypothetical protein
MNISISLSHQRQFLHLHKLPCFHPAEIEPRCHGQAVVIRPVPDGPVMTGRLPSMMVLSMCVVSPSTRKWLATVSAFKEDPVFFSRTTGSADCCRSTRISIFQPAGVNLIALESKL